MKKTMASILSASLAFMTAFGLTACTGGGAH